MIAALDLFIDAAATYRLTRLVVADKITEPLRDRAIATAYESAGRWDALTDPRPGDWSTFAAHEDRNPPKRAVLLTCPWCAGMWVAAAVVAVRRVAPRWWDPLARALTLSALTGLAASNE